MLKIIRVKSKNIICNTFNSLCNVGVAIRKKMNYLTFEGLYFLGLLGYFKIKNVVLRMKLLHQRFQIFYLRLIVHFLILQSNARNQPRRSLRRLDLFVSLPFSLKNLLKKLLEIL